MSSRCAGLLPSFGLLLLPLCLSFVSPGDDDQAVEGPPPAALIQELVDQLRNRLSIAETVSVEVRPEVEKLVTIQPLDKGRKNFLLLVEGTFFEQLEPHERESCAGP